MTAFYFVPHIKIWKGIIFFFPAFDYPPRHGVHIKSISFSIQNAVKASTLIVIPIPTTIVINYCDYLAFYCILEVLVLLT